MSKSRRTIAKEFLDSLVSRDFKAFCSFVRIKHIQTNNWISFDWNNWNWEQREFFEAFASKKRKSDLVIKPRRIGMTTFGAVQDYFFALANPSSHTMVIAQSENVSLEIFNTIKDIHQAFEDLGERLKVRIVPALERNNKREIKFSNGSRIIIEVAKAQLQSAKKTARGYTINRLHCSEVAFWTYPHETMLAVLEAASQAEEILIESTANGANGWFYEQASKPNNALYQVHFFPWHVSENCRAESVSKDFDPEPQNKWEEILIHQYGIDKFQLQWWRNKVETHGLENVLQDYPIDKNSCFRAKDSSFIRGDDEIWLYNNTVAPDLVREESKLPIMYWDTPRPGERYILAADAAFGRGQDNSAFYVLDSMGKIVCGGASNEISPNEFAVVLMDIGREFNTALIVVESQGPGHTVIVLMENEGYPNLFKHENKDYFGFNTTAISRTMMFYHIQQYIRDKVHCIPDIGLANELMTIKITKTNSNMEKPAAPKGNTDDRVLAFGIALIIWHSKPVINEIGYWGGGSASSGGSRGQREIRRETRGIGKRPFGFV